MMRILLVDDHEPMAAACEAVLNAESDIEVVGLCFHWKEAAVEARRLKPDIILMDLCMPDNRTEPGISEPEGITAIREVRKVDPRVPILVLTELRRPEWEAQALEAGARRYLPKTISRERLVKAIREAVVPDAAPELANSPSLAGPDEHLA